RAAFTHPEDAPAERPTVASQPPLAVPTVRTISQASTKTVITAKPPGTISFYDGTTLLGIMTITKGSAS
ncbi:MAG: hypothetical protein WCK41_10640, partial [Actinomycetes bacterium]